MKAFKVSTQSAFLFFSLFTISSVSAKIAPLNLAVPPVDVSIASPQYGNTTVAPVTTTPPSFTTNNNISTNLATAPACGWHNGRYYSLPCTSYPIDNGLAFLLIAGIAVGVRVILKKTKNLSLAKF